jgi:hypothetical protein
VTTWSGFAASKDSIEAGNIDVKDIVSGVVVVTAATHPERMPTC